MGVRVSKVAPPADCITGTYKHIHDGYVSLRNSCKTKMTKTWLPSSEMSPRKMKSNSIIEHQRRYVEIFDVEMGIYFEISCGLRVHKI